MSDIVERLRMKFPGAYLGAGQYEAVDATPLATEAADEIERLRTTLRQALGIIAEFGNLNGFRNMSNAELGKAVIGMAERIVAVLPPPPEKENT